MIIVIGCSEKKEAGSVPAFDKYLARQHDVVRESIQDLWAAGHEVFILSAQFGLVPAHKSIPDYDLRLTADRAVELGKQVRKVLAEVEGDHDEVRVYGSKLYRSVVAAATSLPVEGIVGQDRGCGDHFSALKQFLEDFI
jgi:hypothetical protein